MSQIGNLKYLVISEMCGNSFIGFPSFFLLFFLASQPFWYHPL